MIETADVQVAQRLTALREDTDDRVALAVALVVRALRGGSVCVDLGSAAEQTEVADLAAAVKASPLLTGPPILRLNGDLLYLDRYWLEEQQVCDDVLAMMAATPPSAFPDTARLFPKGYEEQRAATEVALSQGLTVLTGGPGTGKTTTVARLLALLVEQAKMTSNARLRIALAAPTGKAAARLQEAVQLEVARLEPADQQALAGCTRRRCIGCSAAGRIRRRGSGTIAVTGCRMT